MEPYQEQVVAEKAELDERIAKLMAFINSPKFLTVPVEEVARLARQAVAMQNYSGVLGERIAAFK